MTEKQKDYGKERSRGERLAYIKAEIKQLKRMYRDSWKEEVLDTCVEALEDRIERIIREEV